MAAILPGISVDDSGRVSVDAKCGKLLFDLALEFEGIVSAPVDVEHVLAALILAVREQGLTVVSDVEMAPSNPVLLNAVRDCLPVIFERYGSDLGEPN